jgi:UDP-N-acetylmuramoyl-L-alanyl-D-glutamate--2,6-diaminopimelate ligase
MSKRLSQFSGAVSVLETHLPRSAGSDTQITDPEITDLVYDSRHVKAGSLFFALPGLHADGSTFIAQAIAKGAKAIVHGMPLDSYDPSVAYLRVENPRFAMSPLAAAFYDHPSKDLVVIGVTGTEGKSTTVSLVFQLLRLCGKKAGFISTVDYCVGTEVLPNPEHQTTPEALTVQKKLAEMRDNGLEYAVIESSSHGLSPKTNRLGNVAFDVGIMTNVTHEHMEFHGTHEQYKSDKANLFRALDKNDHFKRGAAVPSFGVVNEEDPASAFFKDATTKPVYGYSTWAIVRQGLSASDITSDPRGVDFVMTESGDRSYKVRINLPGAFNVYNTLATVIAVSRLLGTEVSDLIPLLEKLMPVKGRMTVIDEGQPFEVLVDYAHTPSSFQAIFPSLRRRIDGKIISLFGSGGERDTMKRPEQGRIAGDYSDIVILSDEDPRGEDPTELLEMIAAGCPGKKRDETLYIIPNRPRAIRKAISLARAGDLVLLLGKGHENSIIYKDHTEPYDEITEARKALHEAGWSKK